MKGVVDIEFIMAVFVLLGSISFTTLTIGREFFSIREASLSETYKQNSIAIYQMLVFDKGTPEDWWDNVPLSSIKKLGFSSADKLVLDSGKVGRLHTICSTTGGYNKVKDILGVQGDIILSIKTLDGMAIMSCKPTLETLSGQKFPAEGYAVIDTTRKIVKFTSILVV